MNKVVVAALVDVILYSMSDVESVIGIFLVEFEGALFSWLPVNCAAVVDVDINLVPDKKYCDVDKIQKSSLPW